MVRGLDYSLNVSSTTRLGRLQVGLLSTYLARRDKQPFEGSAILNDAGRFDVDQLQAYPHWRGVGHVAWQRGPWQLWYALQYIGTLTEDVALDPGTYRHAIPAVTYHDIDCAYEFGGHTRVRFGVSNLADKDPPFISQNADANTDAATYRLLGRTFFAEVRFRLQ